MRNLLFAVVIATLPSFAQASIQRIEGLGKDREHITDKQIAGRMENVKKTREFWLLRHPDAKNAWSRLHDKKMRAIIESAAAPYRTNPDLLAQIVFVESYGKCDVKSESGPAGCAQLTQAVVEDYNKRASKDRRLFIGKVPTGKSHYETVKEWQGHGKNRKRVTVKKKVDEYKFVDDRFDPAKAIPVMAWQFAVLHEIFGSDDLAIQAYHDGIGRMLTTVSLYTGIPEPVKVGKRRVINPKRREVYEKTAASIIREFGITWPQVFFHNSPTYKPALYKHLEKLRAKVDFAPTYYFSVMEAGELLKLAEFPYLDRVSRYVNRFGNTSLVNPMFAFYSQEEWEKMQVADLAGLQNPTKDKELVDLPTPWRNYGIAPRIIGDGPIAQMDPAHQAEYIKAAPETVGCLLYIVNELRLYEEEVARSAKRKPAPFEPIELTSLARSKEYQDWLINGRIINGFKIKGNPNARTKWPTHTIRQAFDIAFAKVHNPRKANLLFILFDLKNEGMIEFLWENKAQTTLHVVPYPEWRGFFLSVYRQAVPQPASRKTQ